MTFLFITINTFQFTVKVVFPPMVAFPNPLMKKYNLKIFKNKDGSKFLINLDRNMEETISMEVY